MAKRLTREIALARAAACESAAEHLTLDWTDDPIEKEQAEYVENVLRQMLDFWEEKAGRLAKAQARIESGNYEAGL